MACEKKLQTDVLVALGSRQDVMIWRQQSGVFRSMNDPARRVRVGTAGMSDALAVVEVEITPEMVGKRVGVAVGLEFKSGSGKQSKAQAAWQRALEKSGGKYALIRSVDDAEKVVEKIKCALDV